MSSKTYESDIVRYQYFSKTSTSAEMTNKQYTISVSYDNS